MEGKLNVCFIIYLFFFNLLPIKDDPEIWSYFNNNQKIPETESSDLVESIKLIYYAMETVRNFPNGL